LFIICRGEKRVKWSIQGTKIGGNFRDQWDQKHQRENQKVENSEGRKFRGRCEGAKTAKGVKMAVARGWIRDRSPDEWSPKGTSEEAPYICPTREQEGTEGREKGGKVTYWEKFRESDCREV
jgi:hypothetical protein